MVALQSLIEYYKEMRIKRIVSPNEAEFQAYYILTHSWNNEIVSKLEWELPSIVFLDFRVQLALEIRSLMTRTNETNIRERASVDGSLNHYSMLFNLLRKPSTPFTFASCSHIDFADIRRGALKAMQKAYYYFSEDATTGFLLSDIVRILGFDSEEEAMTTLAYYEIGVENVEGQMRALIGKVKSTDIYGKHSVAPGQFFGTYYFISESKRISLAQRKSREIVECKRIGISDVDIVYGMVQPERIHIAPQKFIATQPAIIMQFNEMKKLPPLATKTAPAHNVLQMPIPMFNFQPAINLSPVKSNVLQAPLLYIPSTKIPTEVNFHSAEPLELVKSTAKPLELVKATEEPSSMFVIGGIFDEILLTQISDVTRDTVGACKDNGLEANVASSHIYYGLLSSIVEEILADALDGLSCMYIFRSALQHVSSELINNSVSDLICQIYWDEYHDYTRKQMLILFVYNRWKFRVHYRKIIEQMKEINLADFGTRLKQSLYMSKDVVLDVEMISCDSIESNMVGYAHRVKTILNSDAGRSKFLVGSY